MLISFSERLAKVKYGIMGWGRPRGEASAIYAIPVSAKQDDYLIIYPKSMAKKLKNLVAMGGVSVRRFESCASRSLTDVKQKLKEMLAKKLQEYAGTTTQILIAGAAIAVLGIISWVLPDPLFLVDEILFTLGGATMVGSAIYSRRKSLPVYRDRARLSVARIDDLQAENDPLLTSIFRAIQAKEKLSGASETQIGLVELEAEWLYRYVNVGEMIESGKLKKENVRAVLGAIEDILPLRRLLRQESKAGRPGAKSRFKLLTTGICERCGITESALTVYCDFYRTALPYLA